MREYKFRGKRTDNGEWVYGSLVIDTDLNQYAICGFNYYNGDTGLEREPFNELVDPDTVGQYTGCKDRKGVEIYEGDIVRFLDAYMYGESGDWDECTCTGQIMWDDEMAQFYVTNRESMGNDDFWEQVDEAEVIGSINTHPHLLEQGEMTD